jgi:hypothetical protein
MKNWVIGFISPLSLTIVAMVLAGLWVIGVGMGYTGSVFIHLLLLGAVVMALVQFVRGRYATYRK